MAPTPEPALEEIPAPPAEQLPPEAPPSEPVVEVEVAPTPEPAAGTETVPTEVPPGAEAPALEAMPSATEPVFVEEPTALPIEPPPIEAADQTMMFRAPAQIAEPMFRDETIAVVSEPELPPAPVEPEAPAVAAISPEGSPVAEATADQLPLTPAEGEVAPAAEQVSVPESGTAVAASIDWELLYAIVHKVVVRMSPPALPPQVVEDLARILAEEVVADLSAESTPTQ